MKAWIREWCEVQYIAFLGDRFRLEQLAIGVLDPVLQSNSENEDPNVFDEIHSG